MKYLLWIIGLFLTFFAQAQERGQCKHALNQQQWAKNQVQFRGETTDRGYDVTHAILDIAINPAQKYIAGNVILKFKITKANGKIIFRDRLDEGRIKHHESIGNKVEEV